MTSPGSGGLRALRAGLLATAAVSLALAAHALAGGHVPDLLALAAAVVAVTCAAVLVTGRRIGRAGTAAGLLAGQAGLHGWFALTTGHACSVTSTLGHAHGAAAHCLAGAASAASASAAASSGSPASWASALMLTAHLVAVALTALLLAHGDALLWRLAEALRPLPRRPAERCPRPTPGRVLVHPRLPVPSSTARCNTLHLRGPPAARTAG